MRRRRIALLLLLFALTCTVLSLSFLSRATAAEYEWLGGGKSTTAQKPLPSSSATSSASSSSSSTDSSSSSSMLVPPRRRRKLLSCSVSTVTKSPELVFQELANTSNLTPYLFEKAGKAGKTGSSDNISAGFGSLNASVANRSTGGAINDRCSQAPPVVDTSVSHPLDSKEVMHARAWSEDEIVATAMRRRGRTVRVLTEFDLAAASPMLLPSLIRFRPLSDAANGNEVARVTDVFSDGIVPDSGPGSDLNGLPSVVKELEVAAAKQFTGRGGERQTISAAGIRRMLAQPELVLIAMASNRTGADRVTKDEYRAFLVRDSVVDVCENFAINGDLGAPVDRLFSQADKDGDGMLDASEIKRANLTDAATAWVLAGDKNGDGMLSAEELAYGLPQCVFLFFLFFSLVLSSHVTFFFLLKK